MPPDRISTDADPLRGLLAAARVRLRVRHLVRGIAMGIGAAGVASVVLLGVHASAPLRIGAAAIVFTAGFGIVGQRARRERTSGHAAAAIERADPSLRNLVITAAQLLESAEHVRPYMRERVLREASRRAAAIDVSRAVPLSRDVTTLIAVMIAAIALSLVRLPAAGGVRPPTTAGSGGSTVARMSDLVVDLTPPRYTERAASRLTNPAALDVLAGTEAIVRTPAGTTRVRVNGADLAARADGTVHVTLAESGYLAVDGGATPRLVPLTVTPDAAPAVKIVAPAKDLRVPSSAVTIPIAASAEDDLALAAFDLRYTVVAGSGEQFTFTEGTLPAAIQRGSDRSWRLDATLALKSLKLEPGDALIYRAVAADRRPGGAGTASSDTFFVEIAGPGDVPLEGVEMPPEKERYALSQAMIVLKLERLQTREKSMGSAAIEEEAGNIAAEQRAVRANFVFLLGGEVEDEEVEAEHSHEISEGRFANQARREIVNATVLMGQVEKALAAVSTREALPPARAAVRALQRAFGSSRYLLRALPSRVRIDPARRLSGDVTSAANWDRALTPPASDPNTDAARAALADLIAISAVLDRPDVPATVAETLRALGERVLSAAARAPDVQPAAKEIAAARTAIAAGQRDAARQALRRAAPPFVKRAQQGRIESDSVPPDAARLAGAAAIGSGGGR